MKKVISILLALIMACSSISVMALEYGEEWNGYSDAHRQTYTDVTPAHWAYDAIERMSTTQWFSGYPDGTFKPNASIKREEVMKVIVQFLGLPLKTTTTSSYYDVSATRWSSPYIEAGKLLFPPIETFNGQNPFQPDYPIKREDVIYALVIAKKYNNELQFVDESVLNMFDDANSISAKLKPYVALSVNIGLVAGKGTSIGAQDPLTRAEFATLLYRATYIGDGTGGGLSDVAQLVSVALNTPLVSELTVGQTLEISATGNMSDGSQINYNESLNPYNSSNNNVVLMNKNVVTAVNPGTAVIKFNGDDMLADQSLVINVKEPEQPVNNNENQNNDRDEDNNQGNSNMDEDEEFDATLTKIEWSVSSLTLNVGDTSRIRVIGIYSDGTTKDLTSEYRIYSTDDAVLEISSNGNLTALSAGNVRVNLANKESSIEAVSLPRPLSVTVHGTVTAEMKSLEWSTESISISAGETQNIKLYAVYSDGSKVDVTEECGIYSMDESIAIVTGDQIKGVSAGETELWFDSMPSTGLKLPQMLKVTVD